MAKTLQKESITPHNFLDCGSGSGLLGGAIRRNWPEAHITGIDFSCAMLTQSKKDANADDTILHNLMHHPWPVKAHGYDLVGAAAVINYAPDAHDFISGMAHALEPGGYMILSYLADQKDTQGVTDDGSTVYLWSREEIEACFAVNGIETVSSRDTRSYSGRDLKRMDCVSLGLKSAITQRQ